MTTAGQRIAAFDTVRGFAILMMVFGHALFLEKDGIDTPAIYLVVYEALKPLRMPILFFVAGIMASSLRSKAPAALARRLRNLIWIYIVWVPIIALVDGRHALMAYGVTAYSQSFLELFQPTTVLWFLWSLTLCTAMIPLFARLPPLPGFAALSLWSVASYFLNLPWPAIDSLGHFAIFFYAGLVGRDAVLRMLALEWDGKVLAALLAAAVTIQGADRMGWPIPNLVTQSVTCIAALYAFASPAFDGRCGEALAYLGRNSLPIYVIHYPLLVFAFALFPDAILPSSYVVPVLLTAVATGISLVGHRAAHRFGAEWLFAWSPRFLRRKASDRGFI